MTDPERLAQMLSPLAKELARLDAAIARIGNLLLLQLAGSLLLLALMVWLLMRG